MSAVSNFATHIDGYREIATLDTTLCPRDEAIVRKTERAQTSFLETIVGAVAAFAQSSLKWRQWRPECHGLDPPERPAPARKSSRERFTSSAPAETEIWSR
jgi:hypothetical protein